MATLKRMKMITGLLLFFFLLPLLVGQLPVSERSSNAGTKPTESKQVVYAASNEVPTNQIFPSGTPINALVLFTHSHEAYEPIVKSVSGKTAVSDTKTNISSLQEIITNHFELNGIQTDVLEVDNMSVLKTQGMKYYQAYHSIRPYIAKQIQKKQYNLVIDFHRDAAKRSVTTVELNGESYARIAIVIGTDHANYKWNMANAETLSASLNELVPNISRGIISKGGEGVDGKYNQDLSKELLLIELGGVDNTEEELNRTVAVLAKAIAKSFMKGEPL